MLCDNYFTCRTNQKHFVKQALIDDFEENSQLETQIDCDYGSVLSKEDTPRSRQDTT